MTINKEIYYDTIYKPKSHCGIDKVLLSCQNIRVTMHYKKLDYK